MKQSLNNLFAGVALASITAGNTPVLAQNMQNITEQIIRWNSSWERYAKYSDSDTWAPICRTANFLGWITEPLNQLWSDPCVNRVKNLLNYVPFQSNNNPSNRYNSWIQLPPPGYSYWYKPYEAPKWVAWYTVIPQSWRTCTSLNLLQYMPQGKWGKFPGTNIPGYWCQ